MESVIVNFLRSNRLVSIFVEDAVGGFVLIQCRGPLSFVEASVIICALVVFLHFSGSCLQWVIGRLKPIQRWLNYNTPVLLLTASDSVYKDVIILQERPWDFLAYQIFFFRLETETSPGVLVFRRLAFLENVLLGK